MREVYYIWIFMKKAFTLIELLIVISALGILAAIVIPKFQSYTQHAKEAIAKDHLRTLRTIIEIYAAKNNSVAPGYPDNDISKVPTQALFIEHITAAAVEDDQLKSSILECPENPFTGKKTVRIILNNQPFPTDPLLTNLYGWVYKPATKNIRLNYEGTDSQGVAYYEY
jgi:prepilin-type N-terminal cleavage/methylation domain-containing protein